MSRQEVVVDLTLAQRLRCEKLAACLWPTERLNVGEVARRLLLEYLQWAASEPGMVETVRV